jgi:hypothetical protein
VNDEVINLYRGDLSQFVARRTALSKALRAADAPTAAAVAKLRKPSVSAWAIDQVAAEDPDLIANLLAAGADARQAQQLAAEGKGSGDELRAASTRLRDSLEAATHAAEASLAATGHATGDETVRQIRTTLQSAATGGAEARVALWRGALDGNLGPAGFGQDTEGHPDPPELAALLAALRRTVAPSPARSGPARRAPTPDPAAERAAAQRLDVARRAREMATAKRDQADRLAATARIAEQEARDAEEAASAAETRAKGTH